MKAVILRGSAVNHITVKQWRSKDYESNQPFVSGSRGNGTSHVLGQRNDVEFVKESCNSYTDSWDIADHVKKGNNGGIT
jgi:hypothetical protein